MTDFIQFHFLTAYPAACLVRDDIGQPKTMMYGAARRGRVSSASLKRAIRVSELFANRLEGHI
ncbi:type I-E CRISPR-associated protein Cas7/Cse4/CasC, partial [Bacillus sp. SIMBA_161]